MKLKTMTAAGWRAGSGRSTAGNLSIKTFFSEIRGAIAENSVIPYSFISCDPTKEDRTTKLIMNKVSFRNNVTMLHPIKQRSAGQARPELSKLFTVTGFLKPKCYPYDCVYCNM